MLNYQLWSNYQSSSDAKGFVVTVNNTINWNCSFLVAITNKSGLGNYTFTANLRSCSFIFKSAF